MIFFYESKKLVIELFKKNHLTFLSNIKLKSNEIKLKLGVRRYKANFLILRKQYTRNKRISAISKSN